MSKIKEMQILPFKISHGLEIKVRAEETIKSNKEFREWLKSLKNAGNCFTALYENEIIICGGVRVILPHVGEAWVICSECIKKYTRELYKYSRIVIENIIEKERLYRVQAYVKADWKDAISFIENLGFELEGLVRKYINGENYYLYARV